MFGFVGRDRISIPNQEPDTSSKRLKVEKLIPCPIEDLAAYYKGHSPYLEKNNDPNRSTNAGKQRFCADAVGSLEEDARGTKSFRGSP